MKKEIKSAKNERNARITLVEQGQGESRQRTFYARIYLYLFVMG